MTASLARGIQNSRWACVFTFVLVRTSYPTDCCWKTWGWWVVGMCRSNMCNEWLVLKWTFASCFWKTRLFSLCLWAKYSIYIYIYIYSSIFQTCLQDLDKHKPITNLRGKKERKKKTLSTCSESGFKLCYLLILSFSENRVKDIRALTLCMVCVLFWQIGQVLGYGNGVLKDKLLHSFSVNGF